MNKQEFLNNLSNGLQGFSDKDRQQYLDYYSEMIDDRIEEGLSEEEAVADIGTPSEAVAQIKTEHPLPDNDKKSRKIHITTWQIALIALGSPVWAPLLMGTLSVILSLFATVCIIIISLYAIAVAVGACAVAGIFAIIPMLIKGNAAGGIMLVGLGLICAGLTIPAFMGLNALTKWLISLIKKLILWLKSRFTRKEEQK